MTEETKTGRKPTEIEAVTMDDGRVVDFPGKRKMLKSSFVQDGKSVTRIDFRNGETILFTCPDSLLLRAAGHGIEQKLGDSTAGLDKVEDMVETARSLADRLATGEWNVARESSGMAGIGVLTKALVESTGQTLEKVREFLSKLSQAEKLALRNSAKIKPIIERLEAGKTSAVDTEDLLSKLQTA